jgi:flavin-dependent dehydrogenase
MHYDVVVIGAGPGGCMSARLLTDAGFKVLLVEKGKIPREKPCGGFLSPDGIRRIEKHFGPIPPHCRAESSIVRGGRLICQGGGRYDLPFPEPGLSVLRSRLDAFLAEGCGADVRDGSEVEDFRAGRFLVQTSIETEEGEERVDSTYLVGADGADSMALRRLRPEFYRTYAAPKLERTMLILSAGEIDWDPEWLGLILLRRGKGIGRLFIKEDMIGIAVNYDDRVGWREELDMLTSFLEESMGMRLEGEALRLIAGSNRMGVGGNYSLGAGCSFLVGEAAGLLDPWGFGIRTALESAEIAAESLIESAGENITPHLRYRYRMQGMLERLNKERKHISGTVGDFDVASLAGDKSLVARRDRLRLRRRFNK